ncbi:hypothetical protein LINGRAPRIM_LOCUS2138 [Linum grandiflorum]
MDLDRSAGIEEVLVEDVTHEETMEEVRPEPLTIRDSPAQKPQQNARDRGTTQLFRKYDNMYIADSDSEDVAEASKEEDEMSEDEDDPLCPAIRFTAAEKISLRREWRSASVIKGFDQRVPYLPLACRLNFLWAKQGDIQIFDLSNSCYLVRFREKTDYEIAITGGPWMLGDTYLTVHRWHKGFNPWTAEVNKTLVWVQLPDLPVEFYHLSTVKKIARRIGTPV